MSSHLSVAFLVPAPLPRSRRLELVPSNNISTRLVAKAASPRRQKRAPRVSTIHVDWIPSKYDSSISPLPKEDSVMVDVPQPLVLQQTTEVDTLPVVPKFVHRLTFVERMERLRAIVAGAIPPAVTATLVANPVLASPSPALAFSQDQLPKTNTEASIISDAHASSIKNPQEVVPDLKRDPALSANAADVVDKHEGSSLNVSNAKVELLTSDVVADGPQDKRITTGATEIAQTIGKVDSGSYVDPLVSFAETVQFDVTTVPEELPSPSAPAAPTDIDSPTFISAESLSSGFATHAPKPDAVVDVAEEGNGQTSDAVLAQGLAERKRKVEESSTIAPNAPVGASVPSGNFAAVALASSTGSIAQDLAVSDAQEQPAMSQEVKSFTVVTVLAVFVGICLALGEGVQNLTNSVHSVF